MWEEHVKTRKAGWLRVRKSNTRTMLIRVHVYHMCVCDRASAPFTLYSSLAYAPLLIHTWMCYQRVHICFISTRYSLFHLLIRTHGVSCFAVYIDILCTQNIEYSTFGCCFPYRTVHSIAIGVFFYEIYRKSSFSPSICWCLVLFRFDYLFCRLLFLFKSGRTEGIFIIWNLQINIANSSSVATQYIWVYVCTLKIYFGLLDCVLICLSKERA